MECDRSCDNYRFEQRENEENKHYLTTQQRPRVQPSALLMPNEKIGAVEQRWKYVIKNIIQVFELS